MAVSILAGSPPNGYGYGDGYGYGSGYGDGYGDGYGYGYGYGSGDGYGYGSGDGYGYGYGSGSGYWLPAIAGFAAQWSDKQRGRLSALQAAGAKIAYWRSDERGLPCNGGRYVEPAAPGVVHKITEQLELCRHALHATLEPEKWSGDRWWIVALIGDVVGDENKYGAREREILGEVS